MLRTLLASVVLSQVALAQTGDRAAAAAAFTHAQEAQIAGDNARAAELFEQADRASPSPEALRSAIRNHRAAGDRARAATLAAAALRRYPDDATTRALAQEVVDAARAPLGRLRARCAPACRLSIDGDAIDAEPAESFDVFFEPSTIHARAEWSGDAQERDLQLTAGQELEVSFEGPVAPPPSRANGPHPAFAIVGGALTLLGLVFAIASGVDTLAVHDRYVLDPTRALYDEGVGKQWRTDMLFLVTGVGLAATIGISLFTDWDQGGSARPLIEISGLRANPLF